MPKTTPEQNKALVLEAFDTLFNKRDYAAGRWWVKDKNSKSVLKPPGWSPDTQKKIVERGRCGRGRCGDRLRRQFHNQHSPGVAPICCCGFLADGQCVSLASR
jgi:hypothetical protein